MNVDRIPLALFPTIDPDDDLRLYDDLNGMKKRKRCGRLVDLAKKGLLYEEENDEFIKARKALTKQVGVPPVSEPRPESKRPEAVQDIDEDDPFSAAFIK